MSSRFNFSNENYNNAERFNMKGKIVLIICSIVLLVTIYFIEKLFFNMIHLVCYFLLPAIILFIILHLLLIRSIIIIFIFPGKNFFFKKMIKQEYGKMQANQLLRNLSNLKNNIENIRSSNIDIVRVSGIRNSKIKN
jgi:uncharacterized ion transporter superfamily protein YfcC